MNTPDPLSHLHSFSAHACPLPDTLFPPPLLRIEVTASLPITLESFMILKIVLDAPLNMTRAFGIQQLPLGIRMGAD